MLRAASSSGKTGSVNTQHSMHHGHEHTGSDLENHVVIARLTEGRESVEKNHKGYSQILVARKNTVVLARI